jgi:YggT family protein
MGILFYALVQFLISVIECLEYILMGYIILGWIVFFGLIKDRNNLLFKVYVFLMTRIEPILLMIRRFVPPLFGLDFSAMVVFFALYFVKILIVQLAILC